MPPQPSEDFLERLGYRFRNTDILAEALSHSSYVNEQPGITRSNERLEFLGDAVLNLIVSRLLMDAFPDVPEGHLSRMRAEVVNEQQLADIAESVALGPQLKLGRGEALTGGAQKSSVLADAMEAVIAAVYLDGGLDAAFQVVRRQVAPIIQNDLEPGRIADYKSRLQERIQQTGMPAPVYLLTETAGPDHDRIFTVQVTAADRTAEGRGKSKKAAEQDAAQLALALLDAQPLG
ncbi:MAG: ribonuclease III [Pseudomonadota bacterium]